MINHLPARPLCATPQFSTSTNIQTRYKRTESEAGGILGPDTGDICAHAALVGCVRCELQLAPILRGEWIVLNLPAVDVDQDDGVSILAEVGNHCCTRILVDLDGVLGGRPSRRRRDVFTSVVECLGIPKLGNLGQALIDEGRGNLR